MHGTADFVSTVEQLSAVDVLQSKGVAIHFKGTDGARHLLQVPTAEAHVLADMLAIALSRLGLPST